MRISMQCVPARAFVQIAWHSTDPTIVLLCPCSLPTSIQEDLELQGSPAVQSSVRLQAAVAARLEHKQLLAMTVRILGNCEAMLQPGSV